VRVDPVQDVAAVVEIAGHPDRALSGGDLERVSLDRDARRDPVSGRIDAHDPVVAAPPDDRGPYAIAGARESTRMPADVDRDERRTRRRRRRDEHRPIVSVCLLPRWPVVATATDVRRDDERGGQARHVSPLESPSRVRPC
jgi:hypothetical protein